MLEFILDGGYMMYPLMACSILALAVILDRMRAFRLADGDASALREQVLSCLQRKNFDEAASACSAQPGPVAAVLLVGIKKYRRLVELGKSSTEIEISVNKSMEDYAPHVLEALERRLNVLILVASVSPLLGMTGTVTGMIRSFKTMSALSGLDAGAVAGGISEALITTAAGLLIAIPSLVFYNFYYKKVDRFVLRIEESAAELIDFITLGGSGGGDAAKPSSE
jgi:biopolymer transport protein ExbB